MNKKPSTRNKSKLDRIGKTVLIKLISGISKTV